jgi:hypothetical protein
MPLFPAALLAATLAAPSVYVSYSFDDEVATGPDTFAIYRYGKGNVRLSSAFHVSGYRSVEIRDVAGDGTMPELQGYFPVQRSGRLFFHFAFLTTSPAEELNVALAGPRWFQHEKDGISFWLLTRGGALMHVTRGAPQRLFTVDALVWYAVDVAYDLGAGTYDLTIHREGQDAPVAALRGQANANGQPGSAVDKFSFVGSPYHDRSNVLYYVDDVVISSERRRAQAPFVAPGRRKLFVDLFVEYRRWLQARPRCLPATTPEDLGLTPDEVAGARGEPSAMPDVADWTAGCGALEAGDAAGALARFERAAAARPGAWIYRLSSALALTALKRHDEADERLAALGDARADVRYAVAMAWVGMARGDLERAEAWLREPAARRPEEPLAAERYYYVLLWQGQYEHARDYALRMGEQWTERAGDACFYARDLGRARELYERAIGREKDFGALKVLYLKVADIAYLGGDLATERRYREHYYGALTE